MAFSRPGRGNIPVVLRRVSCYNKVKKYRFEGSTALYKAAGIVFEARDCGEVFLSRAEKYLVDEGEPEFTVFTTEEELDQAEGGFTLTRDWLRYMLSGTKFYCELIRRGGFMLHSSAVVKDGRAYLISGDPGVGKSTHTAFWVSAFPGAFVLNDDKPAIRRTEEGFMAYGTPWSGKHDISVPAGVPIGGVAFIERAEKSFIEPMPPKEAIKRLLPQTVRRISGERMAELLKTLDCFLRETPVYRLGASYDISSAYVAAAGMEPNNKV